MGLFGLTFGGTHVQVMFEKLLREVRKQADHVLGCPDLPFAAKRRANANV